MSGGDNYIEPKHGVSNGQVAENSFVFRGDVAPGSRRRRDFVAAYHSWVEFIAGPEAAHIYAGKVK